jgi:hypothetical protein
MTKHSPAPWGYEYNPYTVVSDSSPLGIGADIPAYEVFDADCNKVFDTNEDTSCELQEANARLGSAAPRLLSALDQLLTIFDAEIAQGILWDDPRIDEARAAVAEAVGAPPLAHGR